jgi:flagellar M-ring protein FliF
MEKNPLAALAENRQLRLALIVFALLFALLAGAYFTFLRTDYAVLYSGLRPADASAVVAELEGKGVEYKLRDGGATILVPETDADAMRLAVAGSDAASKGMTGFELFNKSDMGLTDFAQKINYQRALQGELARTIMMMDGIADARVHLALPDRSLFRGNRSEPKAAVTIAMRRGLVADEARVGGVQRLVAAAVPDLALSAVVVLDELGRVISPSASASLDPTLPPVIEEQAAVQQYYRARTRAAVENTVPGLRFDVRVSIVPKGESAPWKQPRAGARRDFGLRISVVTPSPLGAEDRTLVEKAIAVAVALDPEAGDAILFTGELVDAPAAAAPVTATIVPDGRTVRSAAPRAPPARWPLPWLAFGAAVFALLLIAIRLRGSGMAPGERDVFVQRIRTQLALVDAARDA